MKKRLILTRYEGESVVGTLPDGSTFEVCILDIRGRKTRVSFTAESNVQFDRREIWQAKQAQRKVVLVSTSFASGKLAGET